jgi:hypothetical protein
MEAIRDNMDVYLNQQLTDLERRKEVFQGKLFILSGLSACAALCDYALQTVREYFESLHPETSFLDMPVEAFVQRVEATKNKFTNSLRSKELLRDFARETGSDPNDYYFDVPRIRMVPSYNYLHAGVSYAYAPHRDSWYGGPRYQINHWMPVLPIRPDQTMAVYPAYFNRPVKNSSRAFDLSRWVNVERKEAVVNIKKESRVHPLPLEKIDPEAQVCFGGNKADIMVFSGTHLHGTMPNHTSVMRLSIDFRFYHVDDIAGKNTVTLPADLDNDALCADYGASAWFHLGDFSPFQGMN